MVNIRSRYDDPIPGLYSTTSVGESVTKQSFQRECDVNVIVSKYLMHGIQPQLSNRVGTFADVSDVGSYQEALNLVNESKLLFDALPSVIRKRFNDNPAVLLDFVDNPSNRDECIKLGLLPKADVEAHNNVVMPDESKANST